MFLLLSAVQAIEATWIEPIVCAGHRSNVGCSVWESTHVYCQYSF